MESTAVFRVGLKFDAVRLDEALGRSEKKQQQRQTISNAMRNDPIKQSIDQNAQQQISSGKIDIKMAKISV